MGKVVTSVCIWGIIAYRRLARAAKLSDNQYVISVDLDKIVTAKGLQSHLASILYEVEEEEKIYIVTKQGKPQAAIVNVDYLMELTGQKKLPTEEYARYDQPSSDSQPIEIKPAETPPQVIQPMPVQPVPEPKPATPPPPQITDLAKLADETEIATEDPYAVTDEQHIDMNGLPVPPIPGQPDLTDGPAQSTNA